MDVYPEMMKFIQLHPILTGFLVVSLALAITGLWYVIAHHLQLVLATLLCTGGFFCGAVTGYKGVMQQVSDLMWIGGYLLVVFPVLYWKLLQVVWASDRPVRPTPTPSAQVINTGA